MQLSFLPPSCPATKWKFEMDMILGMGGLDDIVYGQEKIPKDDKQEEKKKWLKMDKFARGLIYFQISPDYQPIFQSHTTSSTLDCSQEEV